MSTGPAFERSVTVREVAMNFKEVWNKMTGKPPTDKPKPPEQKPAAKSERPSAAEQQKQAAKDRVKTPGPAERFIVQKPEVLAKALAAKTDRESPKPTKHDHVPPSQPKPGPMIQTPTGLVRMTPPSFPLKPAHPATPKPPRRPTNADRMLNRAKNTPPPKPPIKSFREDHPDIKKGRSH